MRAVSAQVMARSIISIDPTKPETRFSPLKQTQLSSAT